MDLRALLLYTVLVHFPNKVAFMYAYLRQVFKLLAVTCPLRSFDTYSAMQGTWISDPRLPTQVSAARASFLVGMKCGLVAKSTLLHDPAVVFALAKFALLKEKTSNADFIAGTMVLVIQAQSRVCADAIMTVALDVIDTQDSIVWNYVTLRRVIYGISEIPVADEGITFSYCSYHRVSVTNLYCS